MRTTEEMSVQRKKALFAEFVRFGSLWVVLETVWQRVCPGFDPDNTRDGHPGVVVSDFPPGGFSSHLAMLIGTSKRGCNFAIPVDDVYRREPGRKTWFSSLPPLQIPYRTFYEKERYVDTGKSVWNRHCIQGLPKAKTTPGETTSLRRLMSNFPWTEVEEGK